MNPLTIGRIAWKGAKWGGSLLAAYLGFDLLQRLLGGGAGDPALAARRSTQTANAMLLAEDANRRRAEQISNITDMSLFRSEQASNREVANVGQVLQTALQDVDSAQAGAHADLAWQLMMGMPQTPGRPDVSPLLAEKMLGA
jgi:hypothetical protein